MCILLLCWSSNCWRWRWWCLLNVCCCSLFNYREQELNVARRMHKNRNSNSNIFQLSVHVRFVFFFLERSRATQSIDTIWLISWIQFGFVFFFTKSCSSKELYCNQVYWSNKTSFIWYFVFSTNQSKIYLEIHLTSFG